MAERSPSVWPWPTRRAYLTYPFGAEGGDGLFEPGSPPSLLADAYFYERPYPGLRYLQLERLLIGPAAGQIDVRIGVVGGGLFIDTEEEELTPVFTAWGSWQAFQWEAEEPDRICRLLFYAPALLEAGPSLIEPDPPLRFLSRCSEPSEPQVRSLGIVPVAGGGLLGPFAGPIRLEEGYNVRLDGQTAVPAALLTSEPSRPRIRLSVQPGGGLGRQPAVCDEPDELLRTISGVPADQNGSFRIIPRGGCYATFQPTDGEPAEPLPGALRFKSDCGVCCACEDYVEAYQSLRNLSAWLNQLRSRLISAHGQYAGFVQALEARLAQTGGIRAFAFAYPKHGWVVSLQAILVNNTAERLTGGMSFVFQVGAGGAEFRFIEASGTIYTPQQKRQAVSVPPDGTVQIPADLLPHTAVFVEVEIFFERGGGRADGKVVSLTTQISVASQVYEAQAMGKMLASLDLSPEEG